MANISFLSVMPLFIELKFGDTLLATGTAFVGATGEKRALITNRHNVTGRNNDTGECISGTAGVPDHLVVWHLARSGRGWDEGKWTPFRYDLYRDDIPLWLEHPTLGAQADFVALPMDVGRDLVVVEIDLAK